MGLPGPQFGKIRDSRIPAYMRDLGPSTGVPGTEFRRATLLEKSGKVIFGSGRTGRTRPGPAGKIVMEMGWHGGLWADF